MRLAEPARELKDALSDLIDYWGDAEAADRLLPELVRLLADEDRDVVRNAAELTRDLAKSESAMHVIARSPRLVTALLKAGGEAFFAGDLFESENVRETGFKSGGVAEFSKTEVRVKEAVAGALWQICKGYED